MEKNITWLVKFIFKKDNVFWLTIQTLGKLFYFLKLLFKDRIKYRRYWRECFNKKFSRKGFILHILGPDLLKDCVEICEAVGVKPFLIFGTLLGFVRENDFIAHDYDIDFGLLDEDFQKKDLIMDILLKKGYKHVKDDNYQILFAPREYPTLYIDFYRVYKKDDHLVIGELPEGNEKRLFCYYFSLDAMNEFRMVNFYDNKILIPKDPTVFLTTAYGNWQTPKKEHDCVYDYDNLYINDIKHQKSENS